MLARLTQGFNWVCAVNVVSRLFATLSRTVQQARYLYPLDSNY